ncbi:HI1506-related protein [Phaeobacter inhibens]|uniref:HI1506-related protein n=1 Tax=Phaeobacter inhibens TaxID=221822 RepID=UPI00076BB7CF|nr:HI1506-related protein [Phaeobacter inhibens]KXF92092.1 hypothetical protein AT574_03815 [Phaeobacter inhibens]WHP69927.1 HI1506-related protein [Phaeobacter inhibens]
MSEREKLKERAKELGLQLPGNVSNENLKAAVAGAEERAGNPTANSGPSQAPVGIEALRVIGPAKGFRRAGFGFGPRPVDIPLADLSEGQIAAIEAEPRLIVARITLGD